MRATLDKDGTLTVTAETGAEGYALACWQDAQKRRKGRPALVVEATPLLAGIVTYSGYANGASHTDGVCG